MHLKFLFKPLTHPPARGENSQQINLKLCKKKVLREDLWKSRKTQVERASKKIQNQKRFLDMRQRNLGTTYTLPQNCGKRYY